MPEDIYYHSFNPQKADKEWVQTKKDIILIAKKIKEVIPEGYESPKLREKKFLQMRKEHDKYLKKLGEPLLQLLEKQGKDEGIKDYRDVVKFVEVAPDNSDQYNIADARYQPAQYAERITISSGDTKAEDEYLKTFIQFRNEEDRLQHYISVPEPKHGALNKRQKEILSILWNFFYNPEETRKELINELISLDLLQGAKTVNIEESWLEYDIVEALMFSMNMKMDDNLPIKEEWIRLFKEKNVEAFKKTVVIIEESMGHGNGITFLRQFLKQIYPVVKDLNEDKDGIFIREVRGSDIRPTSARKILLERANSHYKEIVGSNKIL
jgi:hypothetical protein